MPLAAPSAREQLPEHRMPHGRCDPGLRCMPRPIGVYRGHEGDDNGQSIRAIGSALHLAYQQAAGAPDVATLGRFCSVQPLQSLISSSSDMASHGRQQAGTAYPPLRCHSRLGCTEAMSAAISSPFTSLASHCIWCTRRTRLVPRIRSLALRTSANRPRIRTEATDADATIFVAIGAYSGGSRACSWFSRSLSPPW